MCARRLTSDDLRHVGWRCVGDGWWRIDARLTCASCGAIQEIDCDPTNVKDLAVALAARLFDSVGWRVADGDDILCPDCATKVNRAE